MVSKTRLYDAFGEIIYAVAISDGMVRESEIAILKKHLEKHPWGKAIQWSFDYERKKENSLKDSYEKALETLKENGPNEDYYFLIQILEDIANSDKSFTRTEGRVISTFHKSLRIHFLEYLNENGLMTTTQ